jgi:two-component sensor histidine kinase
MKQYVAIFFLVIVSKTSFAQNINAIVSRLKTDKEKADTLIYFAVEATKKMRYDSAMYWLSEGNNYALKTNNKNLIALYQLQKAGYYSMKGKNRQALDEIKKMDHYLANNPSYHIASRAYLAIGQSYMMLGMQDSAIYFYFMAEAYNKIHNNISNWIVYSSLAELFNRIKDYSQAEKYYLQAYGLLKNNKKIAEYGYILVLINTFYLSWNRPDKAGFFIAEHANYVAEKKKNKINDPLEHIIESLTNGQLETNINYMLTVKETAVKDGNLPQIIIANGHILKNYEKKKKYSEALKIAEENIQLCTKMNDWQSLYFSKQQKYHLLQTMEKYKEATQIGEELLILKDSLLTIEGRDRFYNLEKKYQSQKKEKEIQLLAYQNNLNDKEISLLTSDKKLAAIYLQQEIMKQQALSRENLLMDSIVKSEQNYSELLTNENKLKTTELQKEIDLKAALARENKLKEYQLKRQQQIKWLLLGGATLFLLSGASIFVLYRNQKKKNQVIQKQATDLEVLMKEIHHRVKNNLQVVSSLLDLQSHSITDIQAHEAVKEGRNRVHSMALIHQNLYNEGSVKGIGLKGYVQNLIQALTQSYNINSDKIKINVNIDDLNLDVDTMIPLGLVLNELVSNAFKYAFKDNEKGELNIQLIEQEQQLHLVVSDNGKGFPDGLDIKANKSFGLKLIKAFSQKLKAKLDIYNNDGAVIEMTISKFKLA